MQPGRDIRTDSRTEALEAENVRLYNELEAYRSGAHPQQHSPASTPNTAVLTAELAGLKRQLSARDSELAKIHTRLRALVGVQEELAEERSRSEEREREMEELHRQFMEMKDMKKDVVESDSDSEETGLGSAGVSLKDVKGAGSVAFMVGPWSGSLQLSID